MKWERLLCAKRESGEKTSGFADLEPGSAFEKDYHRIIGSSTFRRLQDKTQVFALDKSDFIRTRLTHSLEVSSFAKSLGERIAQELLEKKKDPAFLPGMKCSSLVLSLIPSPTRRCMWTRT
jgi:dGTPase